MVQLKPPTASELVNELRREVNRFIGAAELVFNNPAAYDHIDLEQHQSVHDIICSTVTYVRGRLRYYEDALSRDILRLECMRLQLVHFTNRVRERRLVLERGELELVNWNGTDVLQ